MALLASASLIVSTPMRNMKQFPAMKSRLRIKCNSKNEDDDALLSAMEQDIQRMAQAELNNKTSSSSSKNNSRSNRNEERQSGVVEIVNKVLIADFFFVLVALLGLLLGLGEKAAFSSSNLLDFWFSLWPVVFQPALGLLMAGAIVSKLASSSSN